MAMKSPLRGHKAAVNCLDVYENAPDMMASGSVDSTCRIWDLRTKRVAQCIAKAFAGESVNSVKFASTSQLYVASHNQIYLFDLRNSSALVLTEASTIFDPSADEINKLHLHPMVTKKPWLAIPDDEGEIGILNIKTNAMHTLRGQHTNICTSAIFRPRCAGYDLVTGGLDCQLIFWEVKSDGSGGRLRHKINVQALEDGLGDSNQMWNPPFIHDLSFSPNGRTISAALGDGTIALIDFSSRSLVRKLRGHDALVNSVEYFSYASSDYLLSAGNDSKLIVWNTSTYEPSWTIPHCSKPNDISISGNSIYVADMTRDISVYELHE